MTFYSFNINRDLKRRLKYNIKNGKLDAFIFKEHDRGNNL